MPAWCQGAHPSFLLKTSQTLRDFSLSHAFPSDLHSIPAVGLLACARPGPKAKNWKANEKTEKEEKGEKREKEEKEEKS